MKTYKGVRKDGSSWKRVTSWFGYKLHLLVDSVYELPLGFEHHYIRGQKKMETRVTLALMVMLAMALGRIRQNQPELMRSLTRPVKRAA